MGKLALTFCRFRGILKGKKKNYLEVFAMKMYFGPKSSKSKLDTRWVPKIMFSTFFIATTTRKLRPKAEKLFFPFVSSPQTCRRMNLIGHVFWQLILHLRPFTFVRSLIMPRATR